MDMGKYSFEMGLEDKVAIVVGATGGIGSQIACALGRFGVNLMLVYSSNERRAVEVENTIRGFGNLSAQIKPASIIYDNDVQEIVEETIERFGRVDILINAAGIYDECTTQHMPTNDWDIVLKTNLYGPFYTMRSVVEHMKENMWGRIINIGSFAADVCMAGTSSYSASKAGLTALTKVVAREVAPYRVTANVVQPGTFDSEVGMVSTFNRDVVDKLRRMTPIGRLGSMAEISSVILFLCSPHSSYINGAVIKVDGGI
jgi:NAD(P)-dependent dehydrogenase (short-subunit alcohol dehydrogenase family)